MLLLRFMTRDLIAVFIGLMNAGFYDDSDVTASEYGYIVIEYRLIQRFAEQRSAAIFSGCQTVEIEVKAKIALIVFHPLAIQDELCRG